MSLSATTSRHVVLVKSFPLPLRRPYRNHGVAIPHCGAAATRSKAGAQGAVRRREGARSWPGNKNPGHVMEGKWRLGCMIPMGTLFLFRRLRTLSAEWTRKMWNRFRHIRGVPIDTRFSHAPQKLPRDRKSKLLGCMNKQQELQDTNNSKHAHAKGFSLCSTRYPSRLIHQRSYWLVVGTSPVVERTMCKERHIQR